MVEQHVKAYGEVGMESCGRDQEGREGCGDHLCEQCGKHHLQRCDSKSRGSQTSEFHDCFAAIKLLKRELIGELITLGSQALVLLTRI